MAGIFENEEKGFQFYFHLPLQTRRKVIDEMNSDDSQNTRQRDLWGFKLHDSTDLFQYAILFFQQSLQLYQNTIKKMHLSIPKSNAETENLKIADLGIWSLNNLEELDIYGDVDVQQIFSKLHKPLKILRVIDEKDKQLPANYQQIYQVRERLDLPYVIFDNQQFLKLSAKNVWVPIGNLTERDIFKFIRSWQNGKIGKEIRWYKWGLKDSSGFECQKLLTLLRIRDVPENIEDDGIEIRHYHDHDKTALLSYGEYQVSFYVRNGH